MTKIKFLLVKKGKSYKKDIFNMLSILNNVYQIFTQMCTIIYY